MRISHLFSQTLRDAPAEAEVISHQLLWRAGFVRPLAAGIFSYLPLGQRTLAKIMAIMGQEIEAIGGQEVLMPVVHPAGLWQETNRWYEIGNEMGRFQDKSGRDMVLAMTHEEVVADLVRREIHTYRQLPKLIYHLQTKWRDDPRPRAGLIRAREFTMLDSYSLDRDEAGLDAQYWAHYRAYFNIFERCELPVIAVQSDVGMMGGTMAHEFIYLTAIGEDSLMLCAGCGYQANRQVATFQKPAGDNELAHPIQKVATPNCKTIAELAAFLGVAEAKTAKAVFLMATVNEGQNQVERFVFAVVRGDMALNETKLANVVGAKKLRPASEAEIRAIGAEPGYASPVGLQNGWVVVDEAVANSPNLVSGANEVGYHLLNVNYGRDYQAQWVADIAAAQEGDGCSQCGQPLQMARGVEVGNIFKLGTRYTEAMAAMFLNEGGESRPVIMGSYGIGVGRLLACIAEHHHDEQGLIWPMAIAPYQIHLVALKGGEEAAESVYQELWANGIEVLYDDRDESAGIKFNDADLIGLPIRLTISKRSLAEGGAEWKWRSRPERTNVPLPQLIEKIKG